MLSSFFRTGLYMYIQAKSQELYFELVHTNVGKKSLVIHNVLIDSTLARGHALAQS